MPKSAESGHVWRRLGPWRWLLVGLAVFALAWTIAPWLLGARAVSCEVKAPETSHGSTDLVVLLHAFNGKAADLEPLRRVVTDPEVLGGADVLECDLPFDTLSMARPEKVVVDLLSKIDEAWETKSRDGGAYQRVFLVGHSMGGLFARKAYVVASGESGDAPLEPALKALLVPDDRAALVKARPWADKVERIVLMAGMNRGWSISHHMSISRALAMSAGVVVGEILEWRFGRLPLIFSVRRGAPFLSNLRIQWLAMERRASGDGHAAGGATTVQLLGSIDDLVSPEDNLDLVSGQDFVYLDVPRSGHANIIDMDLAQPRTDASPSEEKEQRARNGRAEVFKLAITGDERDLREAQVLAVHTAEAGKEDQVASQQGDIAAAAVDRPPPAERPVTDVVFVIHGIRDEGYWTQKIARRVIARAKAKGRRVVAETSTYGYFPMLSFLSSRARRQKVEWLMDRYTEALARYPDARFHYVGHSNGTYLLTKALQEYPACRFHRVVFAGSVVRTDYKWSDAIGGQVEAVLNFVATGDWVVAFFPKALEIVDWQDLGSAGHDGFAQPVVYEPEAPDGERIFVKGGHGAALDEAFWDAIAQFVIDEKIPEDFSRTLTRDVRLRESFEMERGGVVHFFGRAAPLLWILILVFLTAILYGLVHLPLREWVRTVIILAYLALIWTVLTRV